VKTTRWALTACAAAGLAGAALPGAASAAPSYAVVADDLNNPRGLTVAPDGSVYVAEAGRAGRTCLDEQKSICLAPSGAVTRLSGATKRRVVRGLTSVGGRDGRFAVGADGVAVTPNGTIYVAMTAAANCAPTRGLPERARRQVGRLLKARPGGRLRSVANLNELECRTNPDGGDRNSNPYAVLALGGDHEVVVDAGANALWDVRGRRARVLATFPTKKGRQRRPRSRSDRTAPTTWASSARAGAPAGRGSSASSLARRRRSTAPASRASPGSPSARTAACS